MKVRPTLTERAEGEATTPTAELEDVGVEEASVERLVILSRHHLPGPVASLNAPRAPGHGHVALEGHHEAETHRESRQRQVGLTPGSHEVRTADRSRHDYLSDWPCDRVIHFNQNHGEPEEVS